MSFAALDLIKGLIETNLFGHTWLMAWIIIFIIIIILLICRVNPEVALLLPFPVIVAFAEAGMIPYYFKALIYIIAGVYLSIVILLLIGYKR